MSSQKAVVPTVFQFHVPNSRENAISEAADSNKKVISGVTITNKIPAKQAKPQEKKTEQLETSFMVKNVKRDGNEVIVANKGIEAEERSLEDEEEGQGFPYDDQANVLFGTPSRSPSKVTSLTSPHSPVSIPSKPAQSIKSRGIPKPSTVSESEALERVKAQAREKVRSWLQAADDKRARQLREEELGYKKCDLHRAGGRVNTDLKILLSAGVKNRKVTRESIEGVKHLCIVARKESAVDARNQSEAHLRRVYSALPKTKFEPQQLLHDPDMKKLGFKQLQPVVIDFLYEEKKTKHPWIPKEMLGKGEEKSSSESSFEELDSEV